MNAEHSEELVCIYVWSIFQELLQAPATQQMGNN